MIGNNYLKQLVFARGLTRPRLFAESQTTTIQNVQGVPAG